MFNTHNPRKKQSVETGVRGSLPAQSSLLTEPQANGSPCSKKTSRWPLKNDTEDQLHAHTYTQRNPQTMTKGRREAGTWDAASPAASHTPSLVAAGD